MKVKEYLKENKNLIYDKLIFLIELVISLILGIAIYKISYKYQDFNYISVPNTIVLILSVIMLIIILILNTKKYKDKIEKIFLTYIIPIGIMFVVLLPPDNTPDEEGHMFKAYDLSLGNFITELGEKNEGDIYVPQEMLNLALEKKELDYSKIHSYMQKEANYDELVPVQTIAKTYFFINYIPGGITFFVCRQLNVNILLACYIVKLFNFILFLIIGYYCIKKIPFGKLLLAIYMFLPMILQQACSLSADAIINNLAILFIVYNLKLLYQEQDLTFKQTIIYYILTISISLCKYVYFPITFMSLLLIKNKNINKKKRNKLIIISIIISILSAVGWFIFTQNYVDVRAYIKEANVKPIEQAKYILSNPLNYLGIFINTINEYGGYYLLTFVGSELGYANIIIPQIYIIIMLFGVFLLPFIENNQKSLDKIQKILMVAIFIILVVLIITGLYLTWSPLQYDKVAGVQGRYFIPVMIILLLTMISKKKNIDIKNLHIKYFILYFILNIIPIITIYQNFMK